jgi:hypothetical protein
MFGAMLMLRWKTAWKPSNIAIERTPVLQLDDDWTRHGFGDTLPVTRHGPPRKQTEKDCGTTGAAGKGASLCIHEMSC